MFSRILSLLVIYNCSLTVVLSQTSYQYVLSGFGGQYSVGNAGLSATMGQPFPATLAAGNSIVNVGFQQPQMQINTDSIPATTICNHQTVNIPFHSWGFIDTSNQFIAQLSDAHGNFASPAVIGTASGSNSGLISSIIPASLQSGSDYRIRVISSAPQLNGKANPNPLIGGACDSSQAGIALIYLTGQNEFTCYPNPASDNLVIETKSSGPRLLQVFDVTGKLQLTQYISNNHSTIYVGNLADGIYSVCLKTGGIINTQKIVIAR